MTIDEAIERYTRNAEYERTHGNLQGCLDFRQLAEWLKDYKKLLGAIKDIKAEIHNLSPTPTAFDVVDGNPIKDAIWEILIEIDKVIDKHTSGKEDV